jgi:hypothetical protein
MFCKNVDVKVCLKEVHELVGFNDIFTKHFF